MAETVHLFLKANGVDIKGESIQSSLGRQDSIECLYFEHAVQTARDAASGMASGKRQYLPIVIRKRIDKSSPLLFKALVDNQALSGSFKFYRPNPAGDGTTEQFYTIIFKNGRLTSLKQFVAETYQPATANFPPLEEVGISFNTISWTYTNGGITYEDNWNPGRL
jgi:type VI secretion system secreted protein Hcp